MFTLYDTVRRQVVPLELRTPGKVSMYVCGPTVYDAPHIGHGRFVLVYDILRRYLSFSGLEVEFVSNITDIEDKIIARAQDEGTDCETVTTYWEKVWWETMDRLGVLRPDETPHATDYVEQMISMISDLVERDMAYLTSDGVYFAVESVENYGFLSQQSIDDLQTGASDRDLEGKEKQHPGDFVLWKFSKDGEPTWPAPWGAGRPGWHTECVVMSLELLGEGFDLHTGGLDLKFPHHENECAQATALGKKFANHWMHNGFVESGGEKMSKSIGNTMNLAEIADAYDPRAYRLLILQTHYRSPIEVTKDNLEASETALGRIDSVLRRAAGAGIEVADAQPGGLAGFVEAMDKDLDTVAASQIMFDLVRDVNSSLDSDGSAAPELLAQLNTIVKVFGLQATQASVPAKVSELAAQRRQARADKDFQLADEIRDKLTELGWVVEDTSAGEIIRPI